MDVKLKKFGVVNVGGGFEVQVLSQWNVSVLTGGQAKFFQASCNVIGLAQENPIVFDFHEHTKYGVGWMTQGVLESMEKVGFKEIGVS